MNNKKMTWTPEDFRFKLFNKKVCPLCSGKLKHHIKKVYVGKERGPNSTLLRDTDQYFDWYYCENCSRDYSISDLVKLKMEYEK